MVVVSPKMEEQNLPKEPLMDLLAAESELW